MDTILYTTPVGSKLYGINTENSDSDVLHVVLPYFGEMLMGDSLKSRNKSTSQTKNDFTDVDTTHVPLQLLAYDFFKGKTYALEVVHSMLSMYDGKILYEDSLVAFAKNLVTSFSSSNVRSMVDMAASLSYKYGVRNSRLSSLEALSTIVNDPAVKPEDKIPCVYSSVKSSFARSSGIYIDGDYLRIFDKVFQNNFSVDRLRQWVDSTLLRYRSVTIKNEDIGQDDWKKMCHAVRACGYASSILKGDGLTFPLPSDEVSLLLDVRNGSLSVDEVVNIIETRINEVTELQVTTMLPSPLQLNEGSFRKMTISYLTYLYGEYR